MSFRKLSSHITCSFSVSYGRKATSGFVNTCFIALHGWAHLCCSVCPMHPFENGTFQRLVSPWNRLCMFRYDASVKEGKRCFGKRCLWSPLSHPSLIPLLFLISGDIMFHLNLVSLYTHGVKQKYKIKSRLGITCIYEEFSDLTCHSLHRWKDWGLNLCS